jgi:hypothetical protein
MPGINLPDDFKAEYLLLQGFYEDYDKRALSLKALAIPLLGAGLAFGLKEKSEAILAATIAIAASLWLLEAIWKSFQYRHAERIQRIEGYYRKGSFGDAGPPFQVFSSWRNASKLYYSSPVAWLRIFILPFVMLPYVVILAFGVVALVSGSASETKSRLCPANQARIGEQCQEKTIITDTTTKDAGKEIAGRQTQGGKIGPATNLMVEERPARSGLWPWFAGTIILALGIVLGLAIWARKGVTNSGTGKTEAGKKTVTRASQIAGGVSAISAIGAFSIALSAIKAVGEPWWLALPILVSPFLMVLAAIHPKWRSYRWTVLAVSLVLSTILVCVFLIPTSLRWQFGRWPGEVGTHFAALASKLKSTDLATIVAIFISYFIALAGGGAAASKGGTSDAE